MKKIKTKKQLIEEGWIYVSVDKSNNIEVWAKPTGYKDYIQYIYFKENEYMGDIQVTSFGTLCLFEKMYKQMLVKALFKTIQVEEVTDRWE